MEELLTALQSIRHLGVRKTADDVKKTIPSIAVLPFVNMSADPENEYFSDGLAEHLINALTKIKDFRVAARTSPLKARKATSAKLDENSMFRPS
ncbi:MAG: hypothetical protein ACE5NG_09475 [bacterium]